MLGTKEPTFKARIKRGTAIFHDHGFFRWPDSKGDGKRVADADMEFDCQHDGGDSFSLTAPGYGILGMKDQYGNGSVGVKGIAGLIISNKDRDRVVAAATKVRLAQIAKLESEIEKLRGEITALAA